FELRVEGDAVQVNVLRILDEVVRAGRAGRGDRVRRTDQRQAAVIIQVVEAELRAVEVVGKIVRGNAPLAALARIAVRCALDRLVARLGQQFAERIASSGKNTGTPVSRIVARGAAKADAIVVFRVGDRLRDQAERQRRIGGAQGRDVVRREVGAV